METSVVQSIKLAILGAAGLSKDALHIYVGLLVYVFVAVVFVKSIKSVWPWIAAALVAVAGECLDMRDDIESYGHWRYWASGHNILNTLFWPTVLLLLAKLGVVGSKRDLND